MPSHGGLYRGGIALARDLHERRQVAGVVYGAGPGSSASSRRSKARIDLAAASRTREAGALASARYRHRRRNHSCAAATSPGFSPTVSGNQTAPENAANWPSFSTATIRFSRSVCSIPIRPSASASCTRANPKPLIAKWWRTRLEQALNHAAAAFSDEHTNGFRCINGESDGWPGLVLDRYNSALVLKLYSAAWLPRIDELVELLTAPTDKTRSHYFPRPTPSFSA